MQQKICAVPKCRNSATDKFLKFYALPYNDKEVCKEWIRRIGNPKLYIQHVNVGPPVYKICEIHFDYVCKTEVNSELHVGSLPTLHLPTIKNVRPATNCYFNARRSPLPTKVVTDKLLTETQKENICLQVEMCSQICRICCRKGILYDIKNSVYTKKTHLTAIIKSLIPEYVMNSSEVQESLCLNCIKELLTCYLTIIRIENAMKVFSFLLEPLKDKTIADRIVNYTHPTNLDMKTILFHCKLEISADSFKTYISHENIERSSQSENGTTESVDISQPIHEDVNIEVDIDLPTLTLTNKQLTEWTDTSDRKELLNDMLAASMELSNMTNTSSHRLETCSDIEGNIIVETAGSFKQSVKIVRLRNQRLVELPTPLKSLKNMEIATQVLQPSNELTNISSSLTKQLQTTDTTKLIKVTQHPQITTPKPTFTQVTVLTEALRKSVGLKRKPNKQTGMSCALPKMPDFSNQNFVRKSNDKRYENKTITANLVLSGVARDSANAAILNESENEVNEDVLVDFPDTLAVSDRDNLKKTYKDRKQVTLSNMTNTSRQKSKISIDTSRKMSSILFNRLTNKDGNIINSETTESYKARFTEISPKTPQFKSREKQSKPKERKSYECSQCTKVFYSKGNLSRHLTETHGKRVYCPTCKKLVKLYSLSNHMKVHENVINCSECKTQFPTKKLLRQHELEQHPKVCLICSRKFSKLSDIRLHIANHVRLAKNESFQCEFCSKIFNSKIGLLSHLRHREKLQTCCLPHREYSRIHYRLRIVCTICGKSVSRRRMAHHMSTTHALTKRYECDRCSFRSHYKPNLQRHQLTHSGDKPYLCTECGYGCIQKTIFDAHMISHAISPQPIPCSYCEETFKTKYDSRVHSQIHGLLFPRDKRALEKKYTCLLCHKMYANLVHLKSHIAVIHENMPGCFSCVHCDKRYKTYTALSFHNRRKHNNGSRSTCVCSICQKVCITLKELQQHMTAHTGERRYHCDLCPARFKAPMHLRTHKASVHEDRRPFPCKLCNKAFRSKTALNEHIRTHTGERLRCAHCDKTFAGSSNRCKHMREVHNIRTIPIYTKSS